MKEKDKESKNINISELPDFKKELKQNLLSYLSQICQDEEKRKIITQLVIPEGDDTPQRYFNSVLNQPSWVKETVRYNEEIININKKLFPDTVVDYDNKWTGQGGGNTKITRTSKKEILGKEKCIYKKSGDRKQYVKHKGDLITITEYKKIMAAKNKK